MADTLADFLDEATGSFDLIGFRELNTVPVDSSEPGISVSFANVMGSPFDNSSKLAAPDETPPLSEDGWEGMILAAPIAGVVIGNPGRNRLGTLPGHLCVLYEGDFYGRIHVTPSRFALGNVLTDTNLQFEIWNGFFTPQNLNSILEFGTSSLTLNQPTPPGVAPTILDTLASFTYDVDVDDLGPAEIDALYTFKFGPEPDNKCVDFSTSETLESPTGIDWSVSDEWTISLWWKPTTTGTTSLFSIRPPSGSFNIVDFSYTVATNSYRVKITDQADAGDIKTRDYPTEVPDLDTWVNFTIVKSASGPEADALRLYRNGVIVAWTVIGVDDHVDQLATIRRLILTGVTAVSATGQGLMHTWGLWTTELADAEILAIYNQGAGNTTDWTIASGDYTPASVAKLRRYYRLGMKPSPDIGEDLGNLPRDLTGGSGITDVDIVDDAPTNPSSTGWVTSAPTLEITGQRITLFGHCPQRGYTEGLLWKTNIIESWDGSEQRIRSRKLPRQKFDVEYLIDDSKERAVAQNSLFGGLGKAFGVPLFHFARSLNSDMAIGETVVQVTTTDADFRDSTVEVKELAVLWRGFDDFEVVQIAVGGVTASSVTLERPVAQVHDAATTSLIPIQVSVLNDNSGWQVYQTGEVQKFRCEWMTEEATDLADLSGLATHGGTVVFDDPNFIDGNTLEEGLKGKFQIFDSETGKFTSLDRRLSPQLNFVKGFETHTEAESFLLRKRLYGLLGRQKSFYVPSWRKDFELVTAIGAGDTNIDVAPVEYSRFNPTGHAPFGDIMIELNDGTRFFRNIISATVGIGDPAREELEIDSSLGQIVSIPEIKRISYLYKVRLNSDTVEIVHLDRGVYSVRIPLAGVRV
ncbi:hypothetical protein LCGC14_0731640 [marine sediment metagenome]|uniref:Uncharacterized protein n=1 Tax=marine sediment metagenome TaxID=412755 RepID=A0A0F9TGL4_9ZZZZ